MKKMDAYIAIRGSHNITELSDVPPEQMKLVAKKMRPVTDWRVQKTKWVVLRWPSPSMAQLAGMSTEGRAYAHTLRLKTGIAPPAVRSCFCPSQR